MPDFNSIAFFLLIFLIACQPPEKVPQTDAQPEPEEQQALSPFWKNATVYFLLTDRFYNGDESNDFSLGRRRDGAYLRNFMGGDIKGVTRKIEEGYFDRLGVNVIWMTPVVEQIHGMTDEGTGSTYGYHGYWARDWTRIDPALGTTGDYRELIDKAHERGIRILMDVVINHTGPVTPMDSQWPDDWVRTGPSCSYTDFKTTVECTLVENLPDIRTDSDEEVELPDFLVEKWRSEGRLEEETAELDAFFARTGYPRAPRFYIIKWLTDWVRELGIDGYRFDTAKHIEPEVCAEVKKEAVVAFNDWKRNNPDKVLDDADFFMVGEVYNYNIGGGRLFDFGDRKVDFFDHGFESLINFSFKYDAGKSPEEIFRLYSDSLSGSLKEVSVLNYIASHDDGDPFDRDRRRSKEAALKLLLSPGAAQIYYGDEIARPLQMPGANGDANLRSFMNWEDISGEGDDSRIELLRHWQKLGRFRRDHLSVGAGRHEQLQAAPYIFKRVLEEEGVSDRVLVALELPEGRKSIPVFEVFPNGVELTDYYSGNKAVVKEDQIELDTPFDIVLLGVMR